jgi:hypothetical protein
MCFPQQGIAVGLRPGDVIFFNPQYYHCVSGRTMHYSDEKIHLTSFYMKTMQLGLNDNSIGIQNFVVDEESVDDINSNFAVVDKKPRFSEECEEEREYEGIAFNFVKVPSEISVKFIKLNDELWITEKEVKERHLFHLRCVERRNAMNLMANTHEQQKVLCNQFCKMLDDRRKFEKLHLLEWNQYLETKHIVRENERIQDEENEYLRYIVREKFRMFERAEFPIDYEELTDDEDADGLKDNVVVTTFEKKYKNGLFYIYDGTEDENGMFMARRNN